MGSARPCQPSHLSDSETLLSADHDPGKPNTPRRSPQRRSRQALPVSGSAQAKGFSQPRTRTSALCLGCSGALSKPD